MRKCDTGTFNYPARRAVVLEVNSMAGWFGLQKITSFSISKTSRPSDFKFNAQMLKFSVGKRVAEAFIFACEARFAEPGNVHILHPGMAWRHRLC